MGHDLYMSGETAHIPKHMVHMVRGYDPLRELYQWKLVSLLFFSELLLVGLVSNPTYNSAFMFAEGAVWGIRLGTLVPLFLLLGTIPFLFEYKHYRKERKARAALRHEALVLYESGHDLARVQPSLFQKLPLPMQIESRRKRSFTIRIVLEICLLAVSLVANYTITLADSSQPLLYAVVPHLLAMAIIGLGVGMWMEMRLCIAGYYLLPSLTIDDESITARYGCGTITIAWRDIRYFALVNSATFRQLPTSDNPPTFRQLLKSGRTSSNPPAPAHEAFEISDGENIICWVKAVPFRHHRLFRFGEVALSDRDYAAFTRQLASLLVEKTNLPLYDLRFATQKPGKK